MFIQSIHMEVKVKNLLSGALSQKQKQYSFHWPNYIEWRIFEF